MASVKMKDLLDVDVLLALLEHPSKLGKSEYAAFEKMCRYVQDGGKLSDKQRAWAREKFKVLGLEKSFDAENLASELKSKGAVIDTASMEALERAMGPKFLTPPPRRAFG